MLIPTRIYVSVPRDPWLPPEQLDIKRDIFDRIKSVGFAPHEFLTFGDFSNLPWSYDKVQYILSRCQGAMILGLVRWNVSDTQKTYQFNSAFNHYEGALALAKNLPTFILMHEDVYKAGIAIKGRAQHYLRLPDKVDSAWLQTDPFLSKFNKWADAVKQRRHIFLGYSSKALATASQIKGYLTAKGVSVMDRVVDLNPVGPVTDEIERASISCMGGIFLFTAEDEATAINIKPAPSRDDVIFEAGFFMHAKGRDKTLLIREEGTILPADLGGAKYLSLHHKGNISAIENDLEKFIVDNL
jgi:Predicted nucleotide-binding protein containing TIR-like domain